MKQPLLLYLLLAGFALSTSTMAQTYLHLEETSGTDNGYLISDVATITFTSTDLNLKETSGVTAFVMDDIQKIIFNDTPPVPVVGISEESSQATGIYPNPNIGVFSLCIDDEADGSYEVAVYNLTGSLLTTITYQHNGGLSNETIDISEFGRGIFFLKISSGQKVSTQKVIVN